MDLDTLKTIGGGSLAAALLGLIYLVGMRMIAAIDRIGAKVDKHTEVDLEHHGEVRDAIIRVESKVNTALELTPVEGPAYRPPRARTHPGPGRYHVVRNEDEGEDK